MVILRQPKIKKNQQILSSTLPAFQNGGLVQQALQNVQKKNKFQK
jgi:hypothetical protein